MINQNIFLSFKINKGTTITVNIVSIIINPKLRNKVVNPERWYICFRDSKKHNTARKQRSQSASGK